MRIEFARKSCVWNSARTNETHPTGDDLLERKSICLKSIDSVCIVTAVYGNCSNMENNHSFKHYRWSQPLTTFCCCCYCVCDWQFVEIRFFIAHHRTAPFDWIHQLHVNMLTMCKISSPQSAFFFFPVIFELFEIWVLPHKFNFPLQQWASILTRERTHTHNEKKRVIINVWSHVCRNSSLYDDNGIQAGTSLICQFTGHRFNCSHTLDWNRVKTIRCGCFSKHHFFLHFLPLNLFRVWLQKAIHKSLAK